MRRHELTDEEWEIIEPLLPQNSRGVPRVDDRRVINGILWRFRTGSPWRDVPGRYGPRTTVYNRFVRWRGSREDESVQGTVSPENGVWDRLLRAVSEACDGDIVMIDSSCVRVHQHGAAANVWPAPLQATIGWQRDQSAQTYPACRLVGRCQDGDPRVPILIKGPASSGHFAPEVFETPVDCQAIFLSPLAA